LIADKPTNYIEVVQAIKRRRLDWENTDADPMTTHSNDGGGASPQYGNSRDDDYDDSSLVTNKESNEEKKSQMKEPPRGASSDPVRNQMLQRIDQLRVDYEVSLLHCSSKIFVSLGGTKMYPYLNPFIFYPVSSSRRTQRICSNSLNWQKRFECMMSSIMMVGLHRRKPFNVTR
jgi:hypothetical protein